MVRHTDDQKGNDTVTTGAAARTRWAGLAAAAVLLASGLVLTGSTAVQGADPAALCNGVHPEPGAPQYTINAQGWPLTIPGDPGGTIHVFYEPEYGYNCAVVVSNGGAAHIDVGLRRTDGSGQLGWDSGNGTVAGPVIIPAKAVCIDVTGAVGERSLTRVSTNCGD